MKEKVIKSQDLTMREVRPEDDFALLEIFNSDLVGQFVNKITDLESVQRLIERKISKYKDSLGGNFVVIDNLSQKIIGNADFKFDMDKKIAEFGYVINEKFWNKGYATKISKMLIQYAFEELKAEVVKADARLDNIASNKILSEKLKMKLENQQINDQNETYNYYVLDKKTYLENIENYNVNIIEQKIL